MTKSEFLRLLEAQLEVPSGSLNGNRRLAEVEAWDSMAAVLFIALADEKLGAAIVGNDIAQCKTVDELLSLLGNALVWDTGASAR